MGRLMKFGILPSRVIEANKHGEAIKIKHFNHEHNLVLETRSKRTMTDTVMVGFFNKSTDHCGDLYFCVRCATVPNVIKCEGHQHFLFFDYKCACGAYQRYGAFKCKDCTFALDFACMTLPLAVRHKCDIHLLNLSYGDENNDTEQHLCDVCEGKRDPNHCYYYCSICDNSVHPDCVLGKFPYLKDGTTWPYGPWQHHHESVSFVRMVDDYRYCIQFISYAKDEAFICSTCDYTIHCKCPVQRPSASSNW
ncbi:hypothetical protein PTKIN_Ptkin13bG0202500 [Pterospermum kingtungense]